MADAVGAHGLSDGATPPDHRDTLPVAPTWQLRCGLVDDGACDPASDQDADGAPDAADCRPKDASVFPDQPDPDLPALAWPIDLNCDGWPAQTCVLQTGPPPCVEGSFP